MKFIEKQKRRPQWKPMNNKWISFLFIYFFFLQYLDIGEDMNIPDDFTANELQTGKWWRHLAAGGVAGAVSRTCTAPLDRIKVFLQVQATKSSIGDSFKYMLREGGVASFWRGNGINVLKIAPESALKFAAYEQVKSLMRHQDQNRQMSIYERFAAGACAGGISQSAIYPLEVLKTRLALRKTGQYTSIVDAAMKIYANEGIKSFYRGYVPNILGIIPYAGIDLAVYETLKKTYLSQHENEQPSFMLLLACGSASSTLGQVCSYPLALVRTRLQAQGNYPFEIWKISIWHSKICFDWPGLILLLFFFLSFDFVYTVIKAGTVVQKNSQHTMGGVFKQIIKTEGLSGLYRGITPNFIKVLPAVSISYIVYEHTSRVLGVNMTWCVFCLTNANDLDFLFVTIFIL